MGKRLVIYPDDQAREIVGGNSPACNRAVECWGNVLRRSMPELAKEEWCYIADVMNGSWHLESGYERDSGGTSIAAELADAHTLNRTGDRWFGDVRAAVDARVVSLVERVAEMTWEQAQYVRTACLFFWADTEIGTEDEWWTIPFRVQRLRTLAAGATEE